MTAFLSIVGLFALLLSMAASAALGPRSSVHNLGLMTALITALLSCMLAKQAGDQLGVIYGCFSSYLLVTVWLSAARRHDAHGPAERFLFMVPLMVVYAAVTELRGLTGGAPELTVLHLLLLMSIALLAIAGDWQFLMAKRADAALINARKQWRVHFALYLFALGSLHELSDVNETMMPLVYLIEALILGFTLYWLVRLWRHHVTRWFGTKQTSKASFKA